MSTRLYSLCCDAAPIGTTSRAWAGGMHTGFCSRCGGHAAFMARTAHGRGYSLHLSDMERDRLLAVIDPQAARERQLRRIERRGLLRGIGSDTLGLAVLLLCLIALFAALPLLLESCKGRGESGAQERVSATGRGLVHASSMLAKAPPHKALDILKRVEYKER